MKETVWNEQYNLGIEEIDNAHQRIFSYLRRLILLKDYQREGRFVYQEELNYLKSSSLKHFAAEERYMQHMDYEGYERHKRLHQYMRDSAIPALEKKIEDSSYAAESMKHLLGFCIGWLAGHIMIEDRAITGRYKALSASSEDETQGFVYGKAVGHALSEFFGQSVQLADANYSGKELADAVYCRLCYRSQHGERVQVFLGMKEDVILKIFSNMIDIPFASLDQMLRCAFLQLVKQLVSASAVKEEYLTQYRLEKETYITYEQMMQKFESAVPKYSLLYDTCYGKIALYILK